MEEHPYAITLTTPISKTQKKALNAEKEKRRQEHYAKKRETGVARRR